MRVDLDRVMEPATAATLPYRDRGSWWRLVWAAFTGRPSSPGARCRTAREHTPAIARGPIRPHSGRRGDVIDLRERRGDPIPERDRLLDVAPADELQARGRAVALGLGGPERRPVGTS